MTKGVVYQANNNALTPIIELNSETIVLGLFNGSCLIAAGKYRNFWCKTGSCMAYRYHLSTSIRSLKSSVLIISAQERDTGNRRFKTNSLVQ